MSDTKEVMQNIIQLATDCVVLAEYVSDYDFSLSDSRLQFSVSPPSGYDVAWITVDRTTGVATLDYCHESHHNGDHFGGKEDKITLEEAHTALKACYAQLESEAVKKAQSHVLAEFLDREARIVVKRLLGSRK